MIEPWNVKQDDSRHEDSLSTFIIFCEDKVSEPEYFNLFASKLISISFIRNCGQHHKQVDYATEYCRKNDLLEIIDGKEKLKIDEGAHVWCVFDRDKEPNDGRDSSFTNSIDIAILKGFNLAWSNDAFELWILLHFEDVDTSYEEYKYRKIYYDRLTEIFKSIPNPNEDLSKAIKNPYFNYKDHFKNLNNFRNIVRSEIVSKTKEAIVRANFLEEFHSFPIKPHHEKSPCTMVHHLVEELIRLGGKEI